MRFRKNLVGLDYDNNIQETVTRVKPQASDANGNPLFLPEIYVDSPRLSEYPFPLVSSMEFSDLKAGNGTSVSQVYTAMRNRVAAFFLSGGDLPSVNAKLDFVLLKNSDTYREFAPLEEIFLGDTVTVIHEGLQVSLKSKCIKYIYDAIAERYIQIELGAFRDDITASMGRIDREVGGISSAAFNVQESLDILFKNYNELKDKIDTIV